MKSHKEAQPVHIGLTDKQIDVGLTAEELELVHEGLVLVNAEKAFSFKQAIRSHWRAALWSFGLSWALVMEGFDTQLVSVEQTRRFEADDSFLVITVKPPF